MDIKEVSNLLEMVLHESSKATQQTEERWAKAFDDQAKIRREELDAQLKTETIWAETRKLEIEAKNKQLKETFQLLAPLMMAAGVSVSDYLKKKGGEPTPFPPPPVSSASSGSAPPPVSSASSGSGAPLPSSEGWRVTMDGSEEWAQYVSLGVQNLKPHTKALLRAFVAGGFMGKDGPPPLELKQLIDALRANLGDEAMLGFMRLTGLAWTQEGPVATPAPAANPNAN